MGLLKKVVGSAAAMTAGALALSRWSRGGAPEIPPPVSGTPTRFAWRHSDLFLVRRGSGPFALLLHDLYSGASSAEVARLAERLENDFTVHMLDLPGFGRSIGPPMRYDPALYIDAIVDLVHHGLEEPTILIGCGRSAPFAAEAAARLGERALGLILIAPDEPTPTDSIEPPPWGSLAYQVLRSPIGDAYHFWRGGTGERGRFIRRETAGDLGNLAELAESMHQYARQPRAKWPLWSLWAGDLAHDPRSVLAQLEAPVLVLWGAEAAVNPAAPEVYEAARPDLSQHVVSSTSRWPHLEAPGRVADQVRSWWETSQSG